MEYKLKEELIDIDSKWKNVKFNKNKIKTINIKNFITDEHIDIMVKYLYIKAYIENNNYEKYKQMYEKMMIKRIGKSYFQEFNKIIDSFKENGYIKDYPIPINKNDKMLNGSHRLACCLYFNINPYVYVFDDMDHNYPIEWFKYNDFTEEEIKKILEVKEFLLKKYTFNETKLNNIYAAIISPIENGKFNKSYFLNHAKYLKRNQINGLFLCGNTGSGMNLNFKTKQQILEYANNLSKDFSLICHVGSHNIEDIEKMIELTNKLNIECIAAMPPYKTINNFSKIKMFYEYIANISKKPVLIYHIPNITNIDLDTNELTELLNINNVIGIKYTGSNLKKLKNLASNNKNKKIFFGRDDLLYDGLKNGANGGIGGCYNLFPSFISKIINCTNEKERLENQEKLNFAIKCLRNIFPTLPGDKFVLESLKIKKQMTDDKFLNYLEDMDDKVNCI